MKYRLVLLIILILALGVRLYHLNSNPPSLNWDEVSHGYNAYSLLTTGMDQWGQPWPIVNFRAYGDYPVPLNLYLTLPFVKFLGLNAFAIRLPHALLGVLTVLASYFLALGVTRKQSIALITALLMAISPWSVFTTRAVNQPNLSVFFVIAGMAAFFHRQRHPWFKSLSIFLLWLSLFSYHTTRIFTPLLLVLILFVYHREFINLIKKRTLITSLTVISVLIFFCSAVFILAQPTSRARSQWVFILNQSAINQIIDSRLHSNFPPLITRLIYNRPVYFVTHSLSNYLDYFTPQFLFLQGGTNYLYSLPGYGVMYSVNFFFFYLGLGYLFYQAYKEKPEYQLLVLWLLSAPLSASITTERYAVTRVSPILPLPQLAAALGLYLSFKYLTKKLPRPKLFIRHSLLILYGLALIMQVYSYLQTYFNQYPIDYSWSWQYGYQQAVQFIKQNYSQYDQIFITKKYGEPHEFVLFFWPWDPADYRQKVQWDYHTGWYWVNAFDKFVFVNDWDIKSVVSCQSSVVSCLLITSPGNAPDGWSKISQIDFLNHQPAFDIYQR